MHIYALQITRPVFNVVCVLQSLVSAKCFVDQYSLFFFGVGGGAGGGSMSQVVRSNNSYKPTTNMAWVPARFVNYKKVCTRLAAACDKVYQLVLSGTPASSTTKTDGYDIAEILLKVELNIKNHQIINIFFLWSLYCLCYIDLWILITPLISLNFS